MSWDPNRYRRYEDERNRPISDLIHAIGQRQFRRIIDLGCGPGNSTEALCRAFPDAQISAVDHDAAMVEAARRRLPGLSVEQADLADWQPPQGVDLLFSNAVFHWLPNHMPILQRMIDALREGGVLALQMPDNLDEPTHRLMAETAIDDPWASAFAGGPPTRAPLPAPRDYVAALSGPDVDVTVWRTIYFHRLANAAAIVDFVAGAGLRPYAQAIRSHGGDALHDAWLAYYAQKIAEAYPPLPDGSVLMAMPRLFVLARKG